MSVQVKRRRESASFLAGFVGAQGELLVDTTNNRIQVHDGATPGGFPAAKLGDLVGRNLILNGNFAINQRGYTSGANAASGVYMHDRWRSATIGGTSYTFTQPVGAYNAASAPVDCVVTLAAGCQLWQIIDPISIVGGTYFLSQAGSATLQLLYWNGSSYVSSSAGTGVVSMTIPAGVTVIVQINAGSSAATLNQVQLERSTFPSAFERRPIGVEIALCQRYFQLLNTQQFVGVAVSGSSLLVSVSFLTMRAIPSALILKTSFNGGNFDVYVSGTWVSSSGMALSGPTITLSSLASIITGFSGMTTGSALFSQPYAFISLSAEF